MTSTITKQLTNYNNKKAFSDLFTKYYKRLCCYADTYLFNFEQSRDIVQTVFVKLWEKRDRLNGIENIESYLFKTVRNSCLDYIKSLEVKDAYNLKVLQKIDAEVYEDKQHEINELTEIISETVNSLPKTTQQIFLLSKDSTKKQRDIAKTLGISIKTVEWNISKVKKELEKKLKNYFSR
jgi:RNA polymerase sigma-70 factor (ECF subfamily)